MKENLEFPHWRAMTASLLFCSTALIFAYAQGPGGRGGAPVVDEPFVGIVTSSGAQDDLFQIESTGVTTQPVRVAAEEFLAGLTDQQRKRTLFPVDDSEWRKWDNRHRSPRQGVGFDEMTDAQRTLAFEMLAQSLSAKGLKKTQDIMKLNGTLAELANNFDEYGEWLYWITIMGEPSDTRPWGWQLDGHHVVINYFVLGDQVVMSPVFMGSEPIEAKQGKFQGTIVMQDEQDKGLKLMQMLSDDQRSEALLMNRKDGNNNLTEAYKDNVVLDYAGIVGSKLEDSQKEALLQLIEEYVGNMRKGHASVRMSEVKQHLDETYFAWIGGTTDQSVYYYRVHSPVILIEFDHQRRVAPFRTSEPTRDHIHTVVRTPNGNDYGKDLLRQHYHSHPH
jgi:predicted nuclease of restriction endonuclease-like (RecB) superfamily